MSTAVSTRASKAFEALTRSWSQTPPWAKLAFLLSLAASTFATAGLVLDYRKWKAIGPGGLPSTIRGYLFMLLLECSVARSDTKNSKLYDQPEKFVPGWKDASSEEKGNARTSFVSRPLPLRQGPQARAKRFIIPQRERDARDAVDAELREAYLAAFTRLGDDNADIVEWKTSVLERTGRAMFLKETISLPTPAKNTRREVGHIHGTDLSGHMTLSFADAKKVIEKGWGERHRVAGTNILHLGYTMVYVPRSKEEIDIFMRLFQASIDYMRSNSTPGGNAHVNILV